MNESNTFQRRGFLQALASVTAGAAASSLPRLANAAAPEAAGWPNKPLRIVVPFGPGGLGDSLGRLLATSLQQDLGQPVIVENKPGGGGAIALSTAARAEDDHTLLIGNAGMVLLPLVSPNQQFKLIGDFEAVGMVSRQPMVLTVPSASPYRTVAELVAARRSINLGTAGNGTLAHLAGELFSMQSGVPITTIAYRGESPLTIDLVAGSVDAAFTNLPVILPLAKSGRLRVLATTGAASSPELPEVKTFKELGMQGMEVESWGSLMAPRSLAPERRSRVEAALRKALTNEEVRKRLADMGATPYVITAAQANSYLKSEAERWSQLIRTRNIKFDT